MNEEEFQDIKNDVLTRFWNEEIGFLRDEVCPICKNSVVTYFTFENHYKWLHDDGAIHEELMSKEEISDWADFFKPFRMYKND